MTPEGIVAGSARAIGDALTGAIPNFRASGVAIIGEGDAALPVVARASSWASLDLSACKARFLLLAEMPPCGVAARALLARAADAGMRVLVLENGAARPLNLDDLIGSPLAAVNWARIGDIIEGKRVLITGGGGSIGSELARRIATLSPARLTLLDSSEHNLYQIKLDLPDATLALADIRDPVSMHRWFARETPDIVFHTAALKQVPLVEAFPSEGVLTNISGLRNVAEAAHGIGADLIFVSTDKAVDPSGVMGASKRFGEMYCQALDRRGAERAIPVRLGNVLGSAGSVSPVFEAQFAAGKPLTVTDAEVTRYFLTIPQAADALLQAAAAGLGAPLRGAALVIELGEALPVVELARAVIRLGGKRPDVDTPIVFTGLRPGEKLHEQLVASDEWLEAEPGPGVSAASSPRRGLPELHAHMERLVRLARDGADDAVAAELFAAIGASVTTELAAAG
jgi:FlaA1/EpsC-like NDP-sugar epimerase